MFRPSSILSTLLATGLEVLAAQARAATPVNWFPVGPPGNPAITAMVSGNSDYVIPFPKKPSLLFAGTAGAAVFRSDDAGVSWAATGPGLGADAMSLAVRQVFHFGVDSGSYDTTVFAGTAGGVYRLAPGASAWTASNTGLTSLDVRALAVGGDGVVLGGSNPIVYAGTAGGLFASADGGSTWVQKTAGLPTASSGVVTALAVSASTLYAGTSGGLFRSTDGGESWSLLDTVPNFILSVFSVAVDPLVRSRVFVSGAKTLPCSPVCLPIAFLPVSLRSLDGGATWSEMSGIGFNVVRAFAATSSIPARAFAGTIGNGVFQSDDGGATWSAANAGLGNTSISSLVIDPVLPSLVFAGTALGVFCAPLGQVAPPCALSSQALCLNSQRFFVTVAWRAPGGKIGSGRSLAITDNTGAFWFFDPTNLELVVKVLDGRSVNGKYWVFYGALTNVEYTITVRDNLTGAVRTYFNPQGQLASVADTGAF